MDWNPPTAGTSWAASVADTLPQRPTAIVLVLAHVFHTPHGLKSICCR